MTVLIRYFLLFAVILNLNVSLVYSGGSKQKKESKPTTDAVDCSSPVQRSAIDAAVLDLSQVQVALEDREREAVPLRSCPPLLDGKDRISVTHALRGEPGNKLLKYLNGVVHETPKCIEREFFEDFKKLTRAIREGGLGARPGVRGYTHNSIYNLLKEIKENRVRWTAEARRRGGIFKFSIDSLHLTPAARSSPDRIAVGDLAEIFVKPDGSLIISYLNHHLGSGTSKAAYTQIGISGSEKRIDRVEHLAALIPHDGEEASIDREARVYNRINDYKRRMGHDGTLLPGLAQADVIQLNTLKKALIQKRYDGDLAKTGLMNEGVAPHVTRNVFRNISTGLFYLHDMGLVHGDLKEANVFANRAGTDIVVSDYGLTYDPTIKVEPRTSATHEAPEMLKGKVEIIGVADPDKARKIAQLQKRDIYSLGIIALHTLPGEKDTTPFETCKHHFLGYDRHHYIARGATDAPTEYWGEYGKCVFRAAVEIHRRIEDLAVDHCGDQREHCPEAIIADSIHPMPDSRPTADVLRVRWGP